MEDNRLMWYAFGLAMAVIVFFILLGRIEDTVEGRQLSEKFINIDRILTNKVIEMSPGKVELYSYYGKNIGDFKERGILDEER